MSGPLLEDLKEKVARAICEKATDNDPNWGLWADEAEAAIAATLEWLIDLKDTKEISSAAFDIMCNRTTDAAYETYEHIAFRAVCSALLNRLRQKS